MKARHAAALALVGWYLMAPPYDRKGNIENHASLGEWDLLQAYDSAAECRTALNGLKGSAEKSIAASNSTEQIARERSELQRLKPSEVKKKLYDLEFRIPLAVCVATDDPRLKEK